MKILMALKKAPISANVKAGLLFFALAGSVVVGLLPNVFPDHGQTPSVGLFLTAGLAVIVLTALFFTYLERLQLGFGRIALVLAFGYNAMLVVVKLIFSPQALYMANRNQLFDSSTSNPNGLLYYILAATAVFLLYMAVFGLMYRFFVKRSGGQLKSIKRKIRLMGIAIVTLALSLIIATMIGGGIIVAIIVFFGYLPFESAVLYLSYILATLGIPIVVALVLAVILSYCSFAEVERRARINGSATLLASFFWIGLSLIFLYHILWIIFMIALVQIWPFRVYTPK